jgi:hypothetical protein
MRCLLIMHILPILLLFPANLISASPVRDIAVLYGHWEMMEPISSDRSDASTQTQAKQDEAYRTFHIFLNSKRFRGFALKIDIPYSIVHLTYNDISRYRTGFSDLALVPSYRWKFITMHAGIVLPLGYDDNIDSLWIGSGSNILKSVLELGYYNAPINAGGGLEIGYKNYLNDSQVGWGSWETFIKGYGVKKLKAVGIGLEATFSRKSLSFRQWGYINNVYTRGYGEPFEQSELTGGMFLYGKIDKKVDVSGGIKRTLYRANSPLGLSFWTQVRYSFKS